MVSQIQGSIELAPTGLQKGVMVKRLFEKVCVRVGACVWKAYCCLFPFPSSLSPSSSLSLSLSLPLSLSPPPDKTPYTRESHLTPTLP